MNDILDQISTRLAASGNVKTIFGEPVTVGNRTVIPVASVRFGFGGGGGELGGREGEGGREGGGGGGGLVARPCGALEITPERTRFIPFPNYAMIALAVAAGYLLGRWLRPNSGKSQ